MTESTRTATCCCGQLSYTVVGEPAESYLCHCQTCQRRIGSSHAFKTWFRADQVSAQEGGVRNDRLMDPLELTG